jgi:hypothetical protein
MTDAGSYPVTYTGYYDAECRPVRGVVPVEETITLHINGQPLVRLMCTPTRLEELALGFLFNEGLIEGVGEMDEVKVLELRDGSRWLDIWLDHEVETPKLRTITSGCSGGTTFKDVVTAQRQVESGLRITPQQVTHLMQELSRNAAIYKRARPAHQRAHQFGDGEQGGADGGSHRHLTYLAHLALRPTGAGVVHHADRLHAAAQLSRLRGRGARDCPRVSPLIRKPWRKKALT